GARGINLPEATYCVSVDTPVLTEDLRWVPAGDLNVGDRLLAGEEYPSGTGRKGARKWVRSQVLKHRVEDRECVRVVLSNGDEMVTTPDHLLYIETRKGIREWRRVDDVRVGWRVPKYFKVWEPLTTFDA